MSDGSHPLSPADMNALRSYPRVHASMENNTWYEHDEWSDVDLFRTGGL